MSDWKDDRNRGPWPFIPQKNKWGYLNNPRWQRTARAWQDGGPDDYDGRESEEPQIFPLPDRSVVFSRNSEKLHHLCGHWHLPVPPTTIPPTTLPPPEHWWYQPSIDVYHGVVELVPSYNSDSDPESGFMVLRYNVATDTWQTLDIVTGIQTYPQPHTARISTNGNIHFYTYSWPYNDASYTTYYGRLYTYKPGGIRITTDVWSGDHSTGNPYDVNDYIIDGDDMDCAGDEVAVAAIVYSEGGVSLPGCEVRVKFSHDAGVTFPDEFTFPALGNNYPQERISIRASTDGTFWAIRVGGNNSFLAPFDNDRFLQLWKSNAGNTSFTKLQEWNLTDDVGAYTGVSFDISDTDGQNIVISVTTYSIPPTRHWKLLVSSNYGVTFNLIDLDAYTANYNAGAYILSDGQYGIAKAYTYPGVVRVPFLRTTDGGASWLPLVNDSTLYYMQMNKHDNEYVVVDCGEAYGTGLYQAFLYSDDYGATWRTIVSPAILS